MSISQVLSCMMVVLLHEEIWDGEDGVKVAMDQSQRVVVKWRRWRPQRDVCNVIRDALIHQTSDTGALQSIRFGVIDTAPSLTSLIRTV